jgi:MoaA/NifB/PqqE/SkfB family radical SAM enzyme
MAMSFMAKNFINSVKKDIGSRLGLNLSKPLQISIQPNQTCNACCLMCNSWHEQSLYLTSEEIIDCLKQLHEWLGDSFIVQIAGGEPLIFPGIYDIFSYCHDIGIICKISTNGIAFNERALDMIIASRLSYLTVSLDSHLSEIHDKFRGFLGAFERAVEGLKYLAEKGNLTLGISSVIMKDNIATLPESVDFFLSLPIHRLLLQPIRTWTYQGSIDKWTDYEYWINDNKAMESFTAYLLNKKKTDPRIMNTEEDIREWGDYFKDPTTFINKHKQKCRLGYDRIEIKYKGDIYLGCTLYGTIGNIKHDKIRATWESEKAKSVRKEMMKCTHPCTSNCYKELNLPQKIAKALVLAKSGLFKRK